MNIRIFDGRYNATAPPFTVAFCLCVPAGRISKMGRVCSSVTTSQQCTAAGKDACNFMITFFIWEEHCDVRQSHGACEFVMKKCYLRQLEFWLWAIIVENRIVNCLLSMHGVHCMFSFLMENFAWSSWNLKLVQILFGTLGAQSFYFAMENSWLARAGAILSLCKCFLKLRLEIVLLRTHGVQWLFSFVMENSCLSQLEFRACSTNINVRHTWCALSVFLRGGQFLVGAGGILSLCIFSWKSDWRLFCYARMVSTVCFLSWWKILAWGRWNFEVVHWTLFCYARLVSAVWFLSCWKMLAWGRWNFELVQLFLKIWLKIVLLHTHGVRCVFSFVMEISCLRQVEFWGCALDIVC